MTAMREQLEKLKHLFDDGLINEEDYRTQKQALLSSANVVTNPSGRGHPQATVVELLEVGMEVGPEGKRYRLERFLGQGGMGAVWLALDLEATTRKGQNVHLALKFLPSDVVGNPRDEARLAEEAEKARQLGHPNIVRVWGWQRDPLTRLPFLEMEYLEGEDLYAILHREGKPGLSFERVMELMTPVVDALKYAWEEHQLVHRDIKPGNILVTKEGKVKLLDFGISAQASRTASNVGPSSRTPGYHAPEAAGRHKVSPKLDVYSLGAVLFELLEGGIPFDDRRSPHTPWPEQPQTINERQWEVLKQALSFHVAHRLETAWGLLEGVKAAQGPSPEELAKQADEAAWAEATRRNDEAGYADYLGKQPQGQYRTEAERRHRAHQDERKANEQREAAERRRSEETEKTKQLERQADEAAWAVANRNDNAEGYAEYLRKQTRGQYRVEAERRHQDKKAEREAKEKGETNKRRLDEARRDAERQAEAAKQESKRLKPQAKEAIDSRRRPNIYELFAYAGIVAIAGLLVWSAAFILQGHFLMAANTRLILAPWLGMYWCIVFSASTFIFSYLFFFDKQSVRDVPSGLFAVIGSIFVAVFSFNSSDVAGFLEGGYSKTITEKSYQLLYPPSENMLIIYDGKLCGYLDTTRSRFVTPLGYRACNQYRNGVATATTNKGEIDISLDGKIVVKEAAIK